MSALDAENVILITMFWTADETSEMCCISEDANQ